jgi:ubiquinone/menaquinone biosynthesis C-methylase UbiE
MLLVAGLAVFAQQPEEHGEHRHHGHRHDATARHGFEDVERWVEVFDDPERDEWQRPQEVVRFLEVRAGQSVADLGAGTGYFTVHLARAVTASGTVYAVDVEPKLIEHIRKRTAAEGFSWVEPVLAAPDDPRLPDGAIDLVLIVDTWHHIDDRIRYLGRLAGSLKPEGRVAIVDFREGDLPVGPPAGHKLSRGEVVNELGEAGWRLAGEGKMLPYQYLLVFTPPVSRPEDPLKPDPDNPGRR